MPLVTLTIRKPKTAEFKARVLDAVHGALVAAGVPQADRFQRVLELGPDDFRFDAAYPDVATSHPDFAYIQGVYDAGFAIGFPDKTFRPDANLTREQMIAIKESVDRGGVDKYYVSFWDSTMPDWKDKQQVNKQFRGAIAEDAGLDHYAMAQRMPVLVIGNVPRSFGAIAMLRPQQPVTRAEAASILWKIGAHNDKVLNAQPSDAPRSAADALAPPTPTPTP